MGEGFHYYSLVIDGVAVADPGSETFYGMGRMASGIEVPFKGGEYYALKDVPHGDIRMKRYYSEVSRSWRRFFVYTPAGYDTHQTEKYPVLYLLHGGGEDEMCIRDSWCSASLSRLRKSPECSGAFVLILCILPNTLKIGGKK